MKNPSTPMKNHRTPLFRVTIQQGRTATAVYVWGDAAMADQGKSTVAFRVRREYPMSQLVTIEKVPPNALKADMCDHCGMVVLVVCVGCGRDVHVVDGKLAAHERMIVHSSHVTWGSCPGPEKQTVV